MPNQIDTPRGVGGKINRNASRQDQGLQVLANQYPQAADRAMNALGYGYGPTTPPAQTTLNSQSLAPQAQFNVVQPKPATEAAGLGGYIEQSATSFQDNLNARADEARTNRENSFQALFKGLSEAEGESSLINQLYTDTVDPAEAELKDINQQILAEQHSARREIEALQKNQQGLFGGALEQAIDDVQRKSIAKQADLSIIQLAKQGKYDSAKQIADRAVTAMLEKQKNRNDALRLNYEENKDLFNTAEQRAFEVAQADRERALELQDFKLRSDYEQKIKQSDPLYQTSLARARQELATTNSVNAVTLDPSQPALANNNNSITAIIANSKIGQGTKTQLANILGVINANADLANLRPDGNFKGVSPLNSFLDAKIPFTNIGIPFREAFRSEEGAENTGYIEAVNLKVQQWASGAALTTEQTKQVGRFTPRKNDTDEQVRTKLNNLTNFMLTQAQSQLQSEGINFVPAKVDLFEVHELLEQASPEQKAELQAAGLLP